MSGSDNDNHSSPEVGQPDGAPRGTGPEPSATGGGTDGEREQLATVSYIDSSAHAARMQRRKHRALLGMLEDDKEKPAAKRTPRSGDDSSPTTAPTIAEYLCRTATRLSDPGRFGRGADYQGDHRVQGVFVENGRVEALVQGTQNSPFVVDFELPFRKPAEFAARANDIVSGERVGAPNVQDCWTFLFRPEEIGELSFNCSCPDPSRVCKHVVAVLMELGDRCSLHADSLYHMRGFSTVTIASLGGGVHFLDEKSKDPEPDVYQPFNEHPPAPLPPLPAPRLRSNPFDFLDHHDSRGDDLQETMDKAQRREALARILKAGHHSMQQITETIEQLEKFWDCFAGEDASGSTGTDDNGGTGAKAADDATAPSAPDGGGRSTTLRPVE